MKLSMSILLLRAMLGLGEARNNDARIAALRKVSAWRVLKGNEF